MAAPRANWKGPAPVSCLLSGRRLPPTRESEKVRFNQLNRNTGNRIKYLKASGTKKDAGASA